MAFRVPLNVWHAILYGTLTRQGPRMMGYDFLDPPGYYDYPWSPITFLALTHKESTWGLDAVSSAGAAGLWQICPEIPPPGATCTPPSAVVSRLEAYAEFLALDWELLRHTAWYSSDAVLDALAMQEAFLGQWAASLIGGRYDSLSTGYRLRPAVFSQRFISLVGLFQPNVHYTLFADPSTVSLEGGGELTVTVHLRHTRITASAMHGVMVGLEFPAGWQFLGVDAGGPVEVPKPAEPDRKVVLLSGDTIRQTDAPRRYRFRLQVPPYPFDWTEMVQAWVTGDNVQQSPSGFNVTVGPLASQTFGLTAEARAAGVVSISRRMALRVTDGHPALVLRVVPNPALSLPAGQPARLSIAVTNVTDVPASGVVVRVMGAEVTDIPIGLLGPGESLPVRWAGQPSGLGYVNVQVTGEPGTMPAAQFIPVTFEPTAPPGGLSPWVTLGGLAVAGGAILLARQGRGR